MRGSAWDEDKGANGRAHDPRAQLKPEFPTYNVEELIITFVYVQRRPAFR